MKVFYEKLHTCESGLEYNFQIRESCENEKGYSLYIFLYEPTHNSIEHIDDDELFNFTLKESIDHLKYRYDLGEKRHDCENPDEVNDYE